MRSRNLLLYGALAIGGYLAWRFLREKIQQGADAVSAPIANAIIAATLPGAVKVNAMAILPNGQRLNFTSLKLERTPGTEIFTFAYQGKRYQVLPRNTQGDYPTKIA